jgi:hypothetical protein
MDFRRNWLALAVVALTVASASPTGAGVPAKRGASPFGIQRPLGVSSNDSDRRIDINNLNMWVTNYGSFAWDILTGNSGLVYPKGTTKTAVFASGLWLGASVGPGAGTEVRIALAEYSQEYGPGKMVAGTFDNPNRADYQVYKVIRFTGNPTDTAHVDRASEYPEDPLVHHSWSEYMSGAVPYGAPWKTYRLAYTDIVAPADTDSVDVPGPDVLGDQMLWCVYNDADGTLHINNAGQTNPLGVEVQQTTFGFNRQGALGNTVFVKFKIINAGADTLKNMFASLWSDPDLGGATDDLVGCDTTTSLGYIYNATNDDQLYGAAPPAVGYDFFLGPIDAVGDTLPLTSFNKYINGTDPGSFDETYNYMQGFLPDGSDLIDPTTGQVTKFFHSGDPVTGSGWLDANPADRRFLLNSGPFVMAPGDSQEVVGAIIVGQGKNRLSSIASLRFFDTFAQAAFDSAFNLPSPPAQPVVDVATDHGKVVLSWDAASRNDYVQPGYKFEGYNVYQGASVSGPWTLLATYDELTPPAVVFDEVFDIETGQIIPLFPVALGSNLGVRFTHTITQDAVRGGNLRDGTEYYFAVTSYSYNAAGKPKVLENPQAVLSVIPQRGAAGTEYGTASATPVIHLLKDPIKPPATDVVTVEVVDPNLVTGHTYKVVFDPLIPPFSGLVGTDTATVLNSWSLVDSTDNNTVVLSGQLNRRGDEDYRVVDGLRVKVNGKYFPKLQDVLHFNSGAAGNRRAIEGVNFGLPYFGGGAGEGNDFSGSSINTVDNPDSFKTVELRFSSTATQKAYRYLRLQRTGDGLAPAIGRYYPYSGYYDCNFQAWDVVNNVQLDVGFVERGLTDAAGVLQPDTATTLPSMNQTWGPTDEGTGDREYLFIFNRPYSATPKDELRLDNTLFFPPGGTFPVLYAMGTKLRDASDVIDDGDYMQFLWANPAIPNDVYVFNTSALVRGDAAMAQGNLSRIRAVPNPYYNRSRYELNQFSRVIRFLNLPETCTIRIFNLAGELVRTLDKSDLQSSVLTWDLQTERQLPVASGVYVYHVDAGASGSTFGRVVVFMEKERLNNY